MDRREPIVVLNVLYRNNYNGCVQNVSQQYDNVRPYFNMLLKTIDVRGIASRIKNLSYTIIALPVIV